MEVGLKVPNQCGELRAELRIKFWALKQLMVWGIGFCCAFKAERGMNIFVDFQYRVCKVLESEGVSMEEVCHVGVINAFVLPFEQGIL